MSGTDPDDGFELARRQGYAQAVEEVATWLEECVGRVGLWHRVEIAADLRDGSWRGQGRLKGLREASLMERRAQALHFRRVPVESWPPGVRAWLAGARSAGVARRDARDVEVARILREEFGLDAPSG